MSKKIVILKPRLDVTFKYFGPVASERKAIEPIRLYWKNFIDLIKVEHEKNNETVEVIEKPLWEFNVDFVKKLNFTAIYIPHHSIDTFDKKKELTGALYYMQMVFPWLFQVDPLGWCASASKWPIKPLKKSNGEIFKKYQKFAFSGLSKFDQPARKNFEFDNSFILFLCQITNDETIKLHSEISVKDALVKTLDFAKTKKIQIIVKPHPLNRESMKPLGRIVLDRINNGENILWARNINIHDLLSNCEAVFTVNSGAGMEAILHNKPVFCYGRSDYASVSHYILKDEINWSERNKYIKNYKGFFEAYVNSMISVKN